MTKDIVSEIKRDYLHNLAENGRREDGRNFNDTRPISIELGLIESAEGSARVKLGQTDLIAGVKINLGEPFPDTPDKGVLTTNAELLPMASPEFELGPPRENAIELARVVDRGIRESQALNIDKLCISPEEKVWIVFIDIHVLDYDGNLFDAATLGAISALTNTVIPASRFEEGEDYQLEVQHIPIACTIAKLGKTLLVDPKLDEEKICEARLTVTTDENGDIRAMQKGNDGYFEVDELKSAIKMAQEVAKNIRGQFTFLQPTAQ
ncbi:MAG: exosome complex protein Rrp42 [Thermoplasmata archaeon]|nr:MAG: exosome complex protein Rrp42 [Thermoplasmata archaeon]